MKPSAKQPQTKMDIRDIVGGHVRRLRTEANLTQQFLADSCDIYRTYLSRIESGTANPTIKVLAALAETLKVEIGEFFKTP
jgi:transcriptional regulator with XRE-family HTH domain